VLRATQQQELDVVAQKQAEQVRIQQDVNNLSDEVREAIRANQAELADFDAQLERINLQEQQARAEFAARQQALQQQAAPQN
jgi:hypothetical protein